MRWLLLAILGLAGGCVAPNSPEAISSYQQTCFQMGATTQAQMFQCVQNQQTLATAEEMRRRDAAGALGRQMLAQNAYRRPQPSTTTCRRVGYQVICNTF